MGPKKDIRDKVRMLRESKEAAAAGVAGDGEDTVSVVSVRDKVRMLREKKEAAAVGGARDADDVSVVSVRDKVRMLREKKEAAAVGDARDDADDGVSVGTAVVESQDTAKASCYTAQAIDALKDVDADLARVDVCAAAANRFAEGAATADGDTASRLQKQEGEDAEQKTSHADAAMTAEAEAARMQQAEEEILARKTAEEEALLKKHAEQEALLLKEAEEEALARKNAEQAAIAAAKRRQEKEVERTQREELLKWNAEEASLKKQAEEEALARKQAEEEALARKNAEEDALASKKAEEDALQKKQTEQSVRRKEEERILREESNRLEEEIKRKDEYQQSRHAVAFSSRNRPATMETEIEEVDEIAHRTTATFSLNELDGDTPVQAHLGGSVQLAAPHDDPSTQEHLRVPKEQFTEQERLKLWHEAARGSPADDATVRAASVLRGYEGSSSAGSSSLANSRGGGESMLGLAGEALPVVWVSDHRVAGGAIVYEVFVKMRGLEWFLEKTWKDFLALRATLVTAAASEASVREEGHVSALKCVPGGAGRANIVLPKLPQERSVGTAMFVVR